MTRANRSWLVLALCALAVAAALGWMTALGLGLERAENAARTAARQEEAARLALWRMDSAFSNELLRASGSLLMRTRSTSPLFRCGFHLQGDHRRVLLARERPELTGFVAGLSAETLLGDVARAEHGAPFPDSGLVDNFPHNANVGEFHRRNQQTQQAQIPVELQQGGARLTGQLVPVWTTGNGERQLVFVQRDAASGGAALGLWADWPAVRSFLLEQVRDLLPGASLEPAPPLVDPNQWRLASIPAVLRAPPPLPATAETWSPIRTALVVAWIATLTALVAVGLVMRAALVLGERRGRFVSAVTHELRTPLTTFRLYAQMLATGMVREEGQRQEYLDTLQGESERLVRVVDGVLQYSRLEGRGARPEVGAIALADLLAQVTPRLSQRAAEAGMTLAVEDHAGPASVRGDRQWLEQILFNLVDNACKYASAASDRRVHLSVHVRGHKVAFEVADHGPGVPAAEAARIFEPFRRGSRPEVVSSAGVGLGLSLAREMARGLGGDLLLAPAAAGARFVVTMPVA